MPETKEGENVVRGKSRHFKQKLPLRRCVDAKNTKLHIYFFSHSSLRPNYSTRTSSVLEISRNSQLIHGTNDQPISEKIERQNRFQEIKNLDWGPGSWSGARMPQRRSAASLREVALRLEKFFSESQLWFSQVHLPQSWANLLWPRSSSCSYVRLLALFQPHCCLRCIVDIAM